MSVLSDYRASIKRLIEAENVEASAEAEGFSPTVARMLTGNKAFHASRSVKPQHSPDTGPLPRGRMTQPPTAKTQK